MNHLESIQYVNKIKIINIINIYIEKIQVENITNTELINKLDYIIIKNKNYSNISILITKRKELIIKKLFYSELIKGLKNCIYSLEKN